MFAKHIDSGYEKSNWNNKSYHLTSSGFNCNCDNLVAESSFVIDQQLFSFHRIPFLSCSPYKEYFFFFRSGNIFIASWPTGKYLVR